MAIAMVTTASVSSVTARSLVLGPCPPPRGGFSDLLRPHVCLTCSKRTPPRDPPAVGAGHGLERPQRLQVAGLPVGGVTERGVASCRSRW